MLPAARASILPGANLRTGTTTLLCEASTSGVTSRPASAFLQRPTQAPATSRLSGPAPSAPQPTAQRGALVRPTARTSTLPGAILRTDTTAVLCEASTSGVTARPSSVFLHRPPPEIRQLKLLRMTPSQTYNDSGQRRLTRPGDRGSGRPAASSFRCTDLLDVVPIFCGTSFS